MADIRFRLAVNGEPFCTAGVEGFSILSAIFTRLKLDPENYEKSMNDRPPEARVSREQWQQESMNISVCGSSSPYAGHIRWPEHGLKIGDEVTIEILGPGESDEPQFFGKM